jgi:hypothetical protein
MPAAEAFNGSIIDSKNPAGEKPALAAISEQCFYSEF